MVAKEVVSALKSVTRFVFTDLFSEKYRHIQPLMIDDEGVRQFFFADRYTDEIDSFIRLAEANHKNLALMTDLSKVTNSIVAFGAYTRYRWAMNYLSSIPTDEDVPLVQAKKSVLSDSLISLWRASPEFGPIQPKESRYKYPEILRTVFLTGAGDP